MRSPGKKRVDFLWLESYVEAGPVFHEGAAREMTANEVQFGVWLAHWPYLGIGAPSVPRGEPWPSDVRADGGLLIRTRAEFDAAVRESGKIKRRSALVRYSPILGNMGMRIQYALAR